MSDELRTVTKWVHYYRHELELPVAERGGFVMLPITARVGVVHLPVARAETVRIALIGRNLEGPMLARQIRWSFLVTPDGRPDDDVQAELGRHDIGLPGVGSAVMLPTGLGRWTREGCYWVVPPVAAGTVPPLSVVITAALAAGA
ncbi:hypothetical protein [Nocardia stercoris]|uniref:Uncharacterized protein n=1 Tax=Nocardia stercoris TaxID=2483361 RepID=A0A3M2L2B3_9NOCA|nr:hypothetical protein [Nocardia stercoris]RMI28688.1 hypothetical protein EBN03_29010 [Nocardia stercoris]